MRPKGLRQKCEVIFVLALSKGVVMVNDFTEKRSETRNVIDQYYSVEFSVDNEAFLYQFKIWDMSQKGLCLIIKEGSAAMKHLNVGDIVKMKYYKEDSSTPGNYLKTRISHISKDEKGKFAGHHVIGIQILENAGS